MHDFSRDFAKQAIAAIKEQRLSTGDFIAIASASAGHSLTPLLGLSTEGGLQPLDMNGTTGIPTMDRVGARIDAACEAAAAGHTFDMGNSLPIMQGLFDTAVKALKENRLVVPYTPGTLCVFHADLTRMGGDIEGTRGRVPVGIHISDDDGDGLPDSFTTFIISTDGTAFTFYPYGSVALQRGAGGLTSLRTYATVLYADGSPDMAEANLRGRFAFGHGVVALLLINDDRLKFRRDVPADALNKSRVKSGKPPLPGVWRAPPPAVVSNYITHLGVRGQEPQTSKSGTHASPVRHERRGHLRRLASGRITRVRSTLVGGLDKHLTRTRSFYEVQA